MIGSVSESAYTMGRSLRVTIGQGYAWNGFIDITDSCGEQVNLRQVKLEVDTHPVHRTI